MWVKYFLENVQIVEKMYFSNSILTLQWTTFSFWIFLLSVNVWNQLDGNFNGIQYPLENVQSDPKVLVRINLSNDFSSCNVGPTLIFSKLKRKFVLNSFLGSWTFSI
jgi:hypothetical protein